MLLYLLIYSIIHTIRYGLEYSSIYRTSDNCNHRYYCIVKVPFQRIIRCTGNHGTWYFKTIPYAAQVDHLVITTLDSVIKPFHSEIP